MISVVLGGETLGVVGGLVTSNPARFWPFLCLNTALGLVMAFLHAFQAGLFSTDQQTSLIATPNARK